MALPSSGRALFVIALAATLTSPARGAGHPDGVSVLRLLGPNAAVALSATRSTDTLGALVPLPPGTTAESLSLEPVVPGYGRLRGGAGALLAFSSAHPGLHVDVAPPLHTLLDKAALFTYAAVARQEASSRGAGVLVGVADTGLDVTHPDFLDASGNTRVAWLLDLSARPYGKYPDLEQKYGIVSSSGAVLQGAVYAGADLAALIASGAAPGDEVGHGTHVTSIAAGNGGLSPNHVSPYVGFAPEAGIVFARVTRDATENIDNDDLVRGVQFLFDRADFMQKPIAVNLSLGSDFGPHDGTMDWEQVLASYVGPDKPGHALVAAAGNSGSILDSPIHQSVRVSAGSRMTVPISTGGALSGSLEVWIAMRAGASLSVGLAGPDGEWIAPVPEGHEEGKSNSGYNAGVINGSGPSDSPIPAASHGAVAVVSGSWPKGTYSIELDGQGTVDLFLEGTGDVGIGQNAGFVDAVREGTVNLPATHPSIIGVGCTINKPVWTTIDELMESQSEPVFDVAGSLVERDATGAPVLRQVQGGEVCWFSSAGPTLTGVAKPEIAAPGGMVAAAMASQALPGAPASIFTTLCPARQGEPASNLCLQADENHGFSQGTSMSAPMVAGTVALLFERDPTLTQDKIVGLLQGGAHRFRGAAPFDDQAGPGELDVLGTLDALDQSLGGAALLPSAQTSWLTLGAEYFAADGSTPVTAVLELRTADTPSAVVRRADLFDPSRLSASVAVDGELQPPPALSRQGPGVFSFVVPAARHPGAEWMTIGATFDGVAIVASKRIPIAPDLWRADYSSRATGGCAAASPRVFVPARADALSLLLLPCALALGARRRRASRRGGKAGVRGARA